MVAVQWHTISVYDYPLQIISIASGGLRTTQTPCFSDTISSSPQQILDPPLI